MNQSLQSENPHRLIDGVKWRQETGHRLQVAYHEFIAMLIGEAVSIDIVEPRKDTIRSD